MKLLDLDACFVAKADFSTGSYHEQQEMNGAQGVLFDCPKCRRHSVLCWFRNPISAPKVPDSFEPNGGRWEVSGTNFTDLTLKPSVNLEPHGCQWHGFVTNGDAS